MHFRSVAAILAILWVSAGCSKVENQAPIKVGILQLSSGSLSARDAAVKDATLLAIEQINARGGLLGRRIVPVIDNGRSDGRSFAVQAERLITQDKVSVIFGGGSSASRKIVEPLFEKYNHLLIYPLPYEGLEQSPNIVYTGAAPNQQITPAVKWCFDRGWRRLFLVGSDEVFPRVANEIIKTQARALGGQVVGEEYLLLGAKDVAHTVAEIVKLKPDVVLNTLEGDTNISFFNELRRAGVMPDKVPTLSFNLGAHELSSLNPKNMAGDYVSRSYFQSLSAQENKDFVQAFQKKYGASRGIDDPMEAGYFGVYLWAQAVEDARTDEVNAVRRAIQYQSFSAPEGIVYVDPDNQHTWKTVRIGILKEDGQFLTVWSSGKPVRPAPYPLSKLRAEWEKFIADLYQGWGQRWEKRGT